MNNQEAIETLKANYPDTCYEQLREAVDMAISALQSQDVPDTNVGDTVSRQAAINALCRRCDLVAEDDEPCTEKCNDIKILEKLPSAQLELSMEIQEILNYLDTTLHPIVSPDNWNVYAELHDMVSKLPSAQPEIIRCKDCEYGEQDDVGRWFCNDLGCQIGSEDGSGYCANAERKIND